MHLAFAPEAGLEYDDMRYNYARGGDPRQLESDLGLFSLKASPGVCFFTDSRLLLRVSPCFLVAVGAMGTFRTTTFISGVGHATTQYYDHGFGDIGIPVIVGPEVNVGYLWPLRDDLGLALRGSAFYGLNHVLKENDALIGNPMMRRVSLGVVLLFGGWRE